LAAVLAISPPPKKEKKKNSMPYTLKDQIITARKSCGLIRVA